MTASEIFRLRTGITNENYIAMAEQAVREYLNYSETDSLDAFASSVGDIAVILYQRDQDISHMTGTAGVKSESFSEGAISTRVDYLTTSDMATSYDTKVQAELDKLRRYRIARVIYGRPASTETPDSDINNEEV